MESLRHRRRRCFWYRRHRRRCFFNFIQTHRGRERETHTNMFYTMYCVFMNVLCDLYTEFNVHFIYLKKRHSTFVTLHFLFFASLTHASVSLSHTYTRLLSGSLFLPNHHPFPIWRASIVVFRNCAQKLYQPELLLFYQIFVVFCLICFPIHNNTKTQIMRLMLLTDIIVMKIDFFCSLFLSLECMNYYEIMLLVTSSVGRMWVYVRYCLDIMCT